MNVEFINPFINATTNALNTMANSFPERGMPFVCQQDEDVEAMDISAVIGLTGDAEGWVAISFQKQVAIELASNMVGEKRIFIDANVRDAVGEIVNMIAGGAKGELSQKGFTFKLAIPTVIVGDHHMLSRVKEIPFIVVPFETEKGKFNITVCLKHNKQIG